MSVAAIVGHVEDRQAEGRGRSMTLVVLVALFALALALEGGWFGRWQQVWIDESTQLSGAMLPFGRMLAWLAGHPEPALGVPADRMPPLSYLIDAAALQLFGASVFGLRLLHLAIALAGMATLVFCLGRAYGIAAAAIAAVLFALSPKIIEASVELRAYPFFLAITCVQIVLLLGTIRRAPDRRRLAFFTLAAIAAVYTHFFGLVSSSALFVALGLARLGDRRALVATVGAYCLLLAASGGILPFVAGSAALSAGTGDHAAIGPVDQALFLVRLVGHPALMVDPFAGVLFLGGFAALLAMAAGHTVRAYFRARASWDRRDPRLLLIAALAAGLTATLAAGPVASGFNPLKPSYSLWMYPLLATLASTAVPDAGAWPAAAAACAAGGGWAMTLFLGHPSWFAHGPERAITRAVGSDPRGVALVYAGANWAYSYYPLTYRYHGRLAQWLLEADGRLHRVTGGGDIAADGARFADLAGARTIILARIDLRSYADLGHGAAKTHPVPSPPPGYRSVEHVVEPGLYALDLTRYVRQERP